MDLKLQAQLTADDYVEAQKLHLGWRAFLRMSLLVFIVIIAGAMAIVDLGPNRFWMGVGLWLIWLFFFCFTYPAAIAKRTRKIFAQQKSLQIPREIQVSDTHLWTKSDRAEGTVPWDEFHKWKSNDKIILIYSSDLIFHMFPRRWFASDADFASFKELLTKVIGLPGKARKT